MKNKIYYVKWVDSHGCDGWVSEDDAPKEEDLYCETVGYVVFDNDQCICLASSRNKNNYYESPITIPRCSIVIEYEITF